jgi:hypothetical protein
MALNKWMVWYLLTGCPHFAPPIVFMKYIFLLAFVFLSACLKGDAQTETAVAPSMAGARDTASLVLRDLVVAEKDKKIVLRWRADSLPTSESFYAIERSNNGVDFNLVGITKTNNSGWIEFSDESPPKGKIFYRVKFSNGQLSYYSEMITATSSVDISCKFYPNPVDKVLIVRSEAGVDVQISDQSGKPLITDKFPGGIKVIDVSALEPGIYVITLFQKETGRQLTEKLVKK